MRELLLGILIYALGTSVAATIIWYGEKKEKRDEEYLRITVGWSLAWPLLLLMAFAHYSVEFYYKIKERWR